MGGFALPSINPAPLRTSYSKTTQRLIQPASLPQEISPIPKPPNRVPDDIETRVRRGFQQGIADSQMHLINTLLMGIGTIMLPVIPHIRKHMSFRMAIQMAPVHMALMLFISFILGFVNGFQNAPVTRQSMHH